MKEFRPVLIFLLKFVIAGAILTIAYNFYLKHYNSQGLPDPYTEIVASTVAKTLDTAGFEAYTYHDGKSPYVWLGQDGGWQSIVNEGCNAISIMIIFIAFIVAFSTTWKQTTLFILVGLIVIQLMNIFRIALLNYIFTYHESWGKPAHDYLFPALIYGTIVALWLVWVRYFAFKKKKKIHEPGE